MNVSKPNKYNFLKNSVCAATMVMALSACIGDDSVSSSSYETNQEYVKAQSEYYANAISQYAVQSQYALTQSTTYLDNTISNGTLNLASAEFGALDLGGSELFIESAFCRTSDETAKHYVWFDSSDDEGNFVIKGVGLGHTGYVMSALKDVIDIDTLGIYTDGEITLETGSRTEEIASSCTGLDIPEGAPVIITEIDLPQGQDVDMKRYEYRTLSCAAGEVGSIQQQILVTYKADGSREAGGMAVPVSSNITTDDTLPWVTIVDSCEAPSASVSFDSQTGMTSSGIDFAALVAPGAGSATLSALSDNLSNLECREIIENASEMDEEEAQELLFDTCGLEIEVAAIASVTISDAVLEETEVVTQTCEEWLGGATTFDDSVDGDLGIAQADAWTGNVILEREIWTYTVNTSGGPVGPGCGDCEQTTSVDAWRGLQIECARYEQLTIECETRLPEYADSSVYTDVETLGFIYDRSNNVSGWADAEELVPNAPDNPSWTGFDWGCSWQKDVEFDCTDFTETNGMTIVETGEANRLIDVLNIAGTNIDVGDWTVTQLGKCSEGETWDCSAVPGSDQVRGGSAERIIEILSPDGGFNDTGLVVDQTALCRKTRDFTCPAGVLLQTGMQERFWEVLDASGTVDDSDDWTTVRNSQCRDTRETFGCEQRVEERTYTGTAPYEGSWTGWTTVSLIDNCGGSGGGSGGGSDVCIMAGARVAMADGTTKDIALLEVGDVTISGRVMQKFARHYDARNHMTEAGRLMTGEGLFNVDGIVGTGRHAFLSKTSGWTELSDAKEAEIVNHDVAMLYNAVMENHILPIVGDSGEIYYYADEMNNIEGLSERAMLRMMIAEKIAA